MGIYIPQEYLDADGTAMGNTLRAFDAANMMAVGSGVISGMAVNSNGTVSAGYAFIGHVVWETGGTSFLSMLSGLTGTFDIYVQVQAATYASTGLATPGTFPNALGYDIATYSFAITGNLPAGGGVKLATVVVNAGSIISVTDRRAFLTTLSSVNSQIGRLCTKETVLYGALTAPLPTPLLFVAPTALTITGVFLAVQTAPVGQAIIAEVQNNGYDVWTSGNYPQIPSGKYSASTTFNPLMAQSEQNVIAQPTGSVVCAAGAIITVNLTQVGTTTRGSTLAVVLEYQLD